MFDYVVQEFSLDPVREKDQNTGDTFRIVYPKRGRKNE